ncbi:MAG: membrane integrity-associated transporter subunit PqiC [Candidatus Kapaibacterium sp.]
MITMKEHSAAHRIFTAVITCMFAFFSLNCWSTKPSHFYSLTPVKGTTGDFKNDPLPHVAIGIRTLKLPEYLLRDQLVTRTATDEILLSEHNRWAEPLEENFRRVLIEDLSKDIPTNNVFLLPAKDSSVTNYQILLEVTEFELQKNNTIALSARWSITKGEAIAFLMDKQSSFTEQISDERAERFESIVAGMSRLTGKLSGEIAAEIRRIASPVK